MATALLSPVIFVRNGALRALEQTEPSEWGAPVQMSLRRLVELEPTDDVRTRARGSSAAWMGDSTAQAVVGVDEIAI